MNLTRCRERCEELAETAAGYLKWSQLAGSYPGHEQYVESEWVGIHGELDAAEYALGTALARLEEETGANQQDTTKGEVMENQTEERVASEIAHLAAQTKLLEAQTAHQQAMTRHLDQQTMDLKSKARVEDA